jgi:serine/threonine-protein kinase
MDFGIAMVPDLEKGMTIDHDMFLGTPLYTSPEQATGDQIDGRADLYSLGLVAFELLTGAPPFDSLDAHEVLVKQVEEPIRPPRLLNPNVPADLNEFVLRATQKRPDDRFQSGREIQAFLSKQTGVTLTEVGVKTLTVLYDHESGPEVELWMNRVKALAAQIPGAVIRFSSEH